MSSKWLRRRPGLEWLEGRLVMNAGASAGTIGSASGSIARPNSVAEIALAVTPGHLTHRGDGTLLALTAGPAIGSSLVPAIVSTAGPSGGRLPLRLGTKFDPGLHPRARAYTRDSRAGPLTVGVAGRDGTTGPFDLAAALPGDINGDGHVDAADERAFASAFNSHRGDANYLPSADANGNGYVGIGDARLLLRNLAPLGPKVPLKIHVMLSPADVLHDPSLSVSGGLTRHPDVTILGRTTPGAILLVDEASNFLFRDAAVVVGPDGHFTLRVHLINKSTSIDFLALDPFGQQYVHVLPILIRTY